MARGLYYSDTFVQYPNDVTTLKEMIPELQCFHDEVVETMYGEFSETFYCAGWMDIRGSVDAFRRYLFTKERQ